MSANIKSTTIIIFLLLFFSTSCISNKDKPKIDDEIVLKIGSFEITRYEFEKNKKKEVDHQTYKNVEDWLKDYIANSYFLADAYNSKYDTVSAINKKVNYASITMLGQFKGYLWDKVEEPKLTFSKNEIKKIYKKQDKVFDLEYFLLPDKISLKEILNNDSIITTEANFKILINKCDSSLIKYRNVRLLYPFFELEPAKDQIYELKQGSIIRIPFYNGKVLIAHLKAVTEINQKDFKEEKDNIYSNLRQIKEKQIVEDKQNSIFEKAKIVINEQVAKKILTDIKNPPPLGFSKSFLADTVLKYFFNKQPRVLLVADFFDYYHNNPFMYVITDKESLNEVLRGIVEEKYLYAESVNLGITIEKKYILDKRDFMNRLILNTYYQNNFYVTKVSDKDMYDYYYTNKQSFSQCKTCYVSVFTFKDKNSAYFNLNLVNKVISQNGIKNPSDTSMMGLLSYHPNVIIETKNNQYPATLVHNIFISKMNTPVGPLDFNKQVLIFVKTKEEGQEIQPFELAKRTIEKQLLAKNMEILKCNKLKELIGKYPITINKIQHK